MKYIITILALSGLFFGCGTHTEESYSYYLKGKKAYMKRNFKKATDYLYKSIELNPNLLNAYIMLSKIYYYKEDFMNAITKQNTVLKKEPNHIDALYWKARTLIQLPGNDSKRNEQIEQYLQRVLEYDEQHTPARLLLALVYEKQSKLKQALYEYKRIRSQEDIFIQSRAKLAELYKRVGLHKTALIEIDSALEIARLLDVPTDYLLQIKAHIKNNK